MAYLLLALFGTAVLCLGGRPQLLVGRLSDGLSRTRKDRVERPLPLLVAGIFCAVASGAGMAWLGSQLAAFAMPQIKPIIVAAALGLGAFELVLPVKSKPMTEPTRSLVAIAVVLIARQIIDAPRLLVFAIAAFSEEFAHAAIAGAIGGALAVAAGWWLGADRFHQWPLRQVRIAFAAAMIVAGASIAMNNHYTQF